MNHRSDDMNQRDKNPSTQESQPRSISSSVHNHVRKSDDNDGESRNYEEDFYEWFPEDYISSKRSHVTFSTPSGGTDGLTSRKHSKPSMSLDNALSRAEKSKFALIILNQRIEMTLDTFRNLWAEGTSFVPTFD